MYKTFFKLVCPISRSIKLVYHMSPDVCDSRGGWAQCSGIYNIISLSVFPASEYASYKFDLYDLRLDHTRSPIVSHRGESAKWSFGVDYVSTP